MSRKITTVLGLGLACHCSTTDAAVVNFGTPVVLAGYANQGYASRTYRGGQDNGGYFSNDLNGDGEDDLLVLAFVSPYVGTVDGGGAGVSGTSSVSVTQRLFPGGRNGERYY